MIWIQVSTLLSYAVYFIFYLKNIRLNNISIDLLSYFKDTLLEFVNKIEGFGLYFHLHPQPQLFNWVKVRRLRWQFHIFHILFLNQFKCFTFVGWCIILLQYKCILMNFSNGLEVLFYLEIQQIYLSLFLPSKTSK